MIDVHTHLYTQMVRMLDILEDYCSYRQFSYERLDGGVTGDKRQVGGDVLAGVDRCTHILVDHCVYAYIFLYFVIIYTNASMSACPQSAIDRYCREGSDRFIFLLCTRAGGVGINLTAADTVVIFDSDWNPQQDIQAQARCHRLGQKKAVRVYRLVTKNTYEQKMFTMSSMKLGLDKAVLQTMSVSASASAKEGAAASDDVAYNGVDGRAPKLKSEEVREGTGGRIG